MSSSSQPSHAGNATGSSVVAPTTPSSTDSAKHNHSSEHIEHAAKGPPESKGTTADRMTENMIYALLDDKQREMDEEIAAFRAAKDEEFRIFERDLRQGRSVGMTKKKGRDTEAFHTAKKRHRGNGYGVSSLSSSNNNSPKALAALFSNETGIVRNPHLPGDQTPQQTPPHEHELEFQGLFTPAYMPLLDCGGHRSLGRPKSEMAVCPSSPKTSPASSHLEGGASAPLTQHPFTRPALPKLTPPHNVTSSSLPSAPQQPTVSLSGRSGSTTSLQSNIRHSSDDQKPRAPKQVKFKFDNIIVLPTASYDKSQEPIANMSDNPEQITDHEFDEMQRGVQQFKIKSSQKMFSTSPLSEPSPTRSPNVSGFGSVSGPSSHFQGTNNQQQSQTKGNASLDGLGGKWSKIKEKDVVGGSRAVQDDSAEVISRAEYEEAEDEDDDYADEGLFDLDETTTDSPEHMGTDGNGTAAACTTKMPIISPSSFHGYDLSLVIPTALTGRYGSPLTHARPAMVPNSLPTDTSFGNKRPWNPTHSRHRSSTITGNVNLLTNHSYASSLGQETDILWSPMRRRSSAKYGVASPEDEPAKSKRLLYRNGTTIPEENSDEDDLAFSPMAASLPVRIPLSPVTGYTDNGDMDSNSYTPKAKSEKGSVSPGEAKKSCEGENDNVAQTTNEPTTTNTFSLSMSAEATSVDNPITDQFATATIGGLHRNAFNTGPDDTNNPSSYRPPPVVGNDNSDSDFMGNPFINGPYASPCAISLASVVGDVGSYVGSIDGSSGYDPADRSSYLKLKRGRHGGDPQSFGERMMLEDEIKAKKLLEKKKNNGRRATQP
ncbi:MAG: hypothetical protein M1840_005326 [Geoglossum simile]|nr:MAG: hypothetical protein M1840_005326 [Geoglossum simile]